MKEKEGKMTAKTGRTGVEYLDVVGAVKALTAEGTEP